MRMENLSVRFSTNIDFYRGREFPRSLPFRPQVGDRVPFVGQQNDPIFGRYPILAVTSVEYRIDGRGEFDCFDCELWFDKNTHPDIRGKILNHERL